MVSDPLSISLFVFCLRLKTSYFTRISIFASLSRQTMECGKAARERDDGDRMVAFELEAAEALAGLARTRGGASSSDELKRTETAVVASATQSQDQPGVAEPVSDKASSMITCPQMAEKVFESSPSQLCKTYSQSNPVIKLRRKLTEAEKQERKIRRILANRESARETIRRRQAMYLELTRKAAEVVEENENLKKKMKLAVEEYNSLKGRNEFLKAHLAEMKKAAARKTEETSEAENPCSSTAAPPPIFLPNQPSIFPCFWPSIYPSSNVFPFQCPPHSHNTSTSQFPFPPREIPCLHQGQEPSNGVGTPLFVVPVPWLLPYLTHSNTKPHTPQCSKCSQSDPQPHEVKNESLSNQNTETEAPTKTVVVPELFGPVKPAEIPRPLQSCQVDDTCDVNDVSTPESCFSQRNQAQITQQKPEDVFAACAARRRRKELLKLKNVHCHDVRMRN